MCVSSLSLFFFFFFFPLFQRRCRRSYGIREVTRLLAPLIPASRESPRRMEFYRRRGAPLRFNCVAFPLSIAMFLNGARGQSASSIYADSAFSNRSCLLTLSRVFSFICRRESLRVSRIKRSSSKPLLNKLLILRLVNHDVSTSEEASQV